MIWMYNKDGAKLFESEQDVPKKGGWVDSPAKVKGAKKDDQADGNGA